MAAAAEHPIICASFIGSDNMPLFYRGFYRQEVDDIEAQLALYAALDQADVHLRASQQAVQRGETRSPDPYLGILSPALFNSEDVNTYGYVSATQVKVFVVIRDGVKQRREEDTIMRSLLKQLYLLYVDAAANPFHTTFEKDSFSNSVASVVNHHASMFV
mmetsp:Transcript_110783/g.196260  ORF Transcript_110783/g.196260 Transcript_110783/m.196260 type:complete len:160 (-) Transcript_110783:52-531(-)